MVDLETPETEEAKINEQRELLENAIASGNFFSAYSALRNEYCDEVLQG